MEITRRSYERCEVNHQQDIVYPKVPHEDETIAPAPRPSNCSLEFSKMASGKMLASRKILPPPKLPEERIAGGFHLYVGNTQ